MSKVGALLKEARKRKKLTLSQVAEHLKIQEEHLENIEKKKQLDLDVFTIGYIKLYAKYLRVNIDDYIQELKQNKDDPEICVVEQVGGGCRGRIFSKFCGRKYLKCAAILVVAVLVIVFLVWLLAQI